MSNPWTIGIGGTFVDFDTINATGLRRECKSLSTDRFSFTATMPGDAAPLFTYKTPVVIKKNGTQWFAGILTQPKALLEGAREEQAYEISGPWWWLEHIVYQQVWTKVVPGSVAGTVTLTGTPPVAATTTEERSHVILGLDGSNQPIKSGACIEDVLDWALGCFTGGPAPFQVGSILEGTYFPSEECTDVLCSEAVKRLLKWSPDAVGWMDYSTSPPTLNIVPRSELSGVTLAQATTADPYTTKIEAEPRHDLVPEGVILKYEQVNSLSGSSWVTTTLDKAPGTVTEKTPCALVMTIPLGGFTGVLLKQNVTTAVIPDGTSSDAAIIAFFRKHNPDLHKLSAVNLQVIPGSFWSEIDEGQTNPDGTDLEWTLTDLPRELVKGAIADWMQGVHGAAATVSAGLMWVKNPGYTTSADEAVLAETIFAKNVDPGSDGQPTFRIPITATNATTRLYTHLESSTPGEPIPTGLAAAYYGALSVLQWQGRFVQEGQEIAGEVGLGNVLNVSGGNSAWAGMDATVQEILEELDLGRTTLIFGPPEHLRPQDMVDILRANRNRNAVQSAFTMATGQTSGAGVAKGPDWTPGGKGSTTTAALPPWINWDNTPASGSSSVNLFSVWFGEGDLTNGFVTKLGPTIQNFQLDVSSTDDSGNLQSLMQLLSGAADPAKDGFYIATDNGAEQLKYADGKMQFWTDPAWALGTGDPSIGDSAWAFVELKLDSDLNEVALSGYSKGTPGFSMKLSACADSGADDYGAQLLLTGQTDDDSIQCIVDNSLIQIELKHLDGAFQHSVTLDAVDVLLHLEDGSGSTIDLDLTSDPELILSNVDGSDITLDCKTGGSLEILIDGNTSTLDGNSLSLVDSAGNTITLDLDTGLTLTDTSGKTIILDLFTGVTLDDGSGNTIALDLDTGLTIGNSILSDGDLDLGATGTVTVNSKVYEPVEASWCDGSGALQSGTILAHID